jgi:hypothetical protein
MTPTYQELFDLHERGYLKARAHEDKCLLVAKTFLQHMRVYLSDRVRPDHTQATPTEKGWWQFPFSILFPTDTLPCLLIYQVTGNDVEFAVQVLAGPSKHDACPANSDGIRTICDAVFALVKDACENSLEWYHEGMNEQRFGISERSKRKV